jgi:hypothetical protein
METIIGIIPLPAGGGIVFAKITNSSEKVSIFAKKSSEKVYFCSEKSSEKMSLNYV